MVKQVTNISVEYDKINIKNWFKYNIDIPIEIKTNSKTPPVCGVYLIYTKKFDLLYIGKASNLQQRLSCHMTINNVSNLLKYNLTDLQKATPLIDNVDICITKNIMDAELLEITLINQLNPIFNRQYNFRYDWTKVNELLCEANTDDNTINALTINCARNITEFIG
jgi:hypothetical protein